MSYINSQQNVQYIAMRSFRSLLLTVVQIFCSKLPLIHANWEITLSYIGHGGHAAAGECLCKRWSRQGELVDHGRSYSSTVILLFRME